MRLELERRAVCSTGGRVQQEKIDLIGGKPVAVLLFFTTSSKWTGLRSNQWLRG